MLSGEWQGKWCQGKEFSLLLYFSRRGERGGENYLNHKSLKVMQIGYRWYEELRTINRTLFTSC